jgi:FkbM family methyltransferase
MPSNLKEHVFYTRKEWLEQKYYIDVLNYVKKENIVTMIDAGGCTGEVTKIFFEKIPTLNKCYIFEANKNNASFIKENLIYNIEIINKCLYYGQEKISLGLNYGDDNVGGYSIKYSDKNIIEKNILTTTLEEIVENIDFIKMDIEGAEKNVIMNSAKIHEINFLEIEFHEELEHESMWKPFVKKYLNKHAILLSNYNHVFLKAI